MFLINGFMEGENIYCVLADDYQAVYDVTEEMLFNGKRRILFLENSVSYSARRKRSGFEAAMRDRGLEPDPRLFLYSENWISSCARGTWILTA